MGRCLPVEFSFSQIAAVVSNPSISGIWMSISTKSNLGCSTAAKASRDVPQDVDLRGYPRPQGPGEELIRRRPCNGR